MFASAYKQKPFSNMKQSILEPMVSASNQVHTTMDYSLFKPIAGNRIKNELHLKRLRDSMEQNYLFTIITVNEKYEIIDGQHRFEIIKSLGLPLNYVICKGYGLDQVHILNQNSKTWNSDDYLAGYVDMGKKDYIIYKQFREKYGFDHISCMGILNGFAINTSGNMKSFHGGKFKIKDLKKAELAAEKITILKDFYIGYKRRTFVGAMMNLFSKPQFEFTEFIQKLKLQPSAITDCTSVSNYITLIEEIYNYRRREKVNLRY